jgi:hypothetical protein
MKKAALIITLISFSNTYLAQDFDDFYAKKSDIHLIYTKPIGFLSLGIGYSSMKSKTFGFTYEVSCLFLSDAVWQIKENLKKDSKSLSGPFMTSNALGCHKLGINVITTEQFILSAGLSASSYIIGGNEAGRVLGAGSYVRADYMLNKNLLVRARNMYTYPLFEADKQLTITPHILETSFELVSTTGLYLCYENMFVIPGVALDKHHARNNIKLGIRIGF